MQPPIISILLSITWCDLKQHEVERIATMFISDLMPIVRAEVIILTDDHNTLF